MLTNVREQTETVMRKLALFSTLILLLGFAPAAYAHGSWGGGWGWRGGCCWGGSRVFIGFGGFGYGGFGYGGYPYYPYPYAYGYPPPYPYYPPYAPYPAYPAAYSGGAYPGGYSGTVSPGAAGATGAVDPATVRAIQSELQRGGYNVGPVDGRVGPRTRAAIRDYERQNGLPVDGLASRSLLDRMRSRQAG